MTAYRQLSTAEYPTLIGLWQQCFGDTEQEITAFWHAVGDQVRVFAAWDGGRAVSMLCALSAGLVDEAGDLLPAAYLYAVCTAPERRNQGLAARLTAYAEAALWRQGVAVTALVPANAGLFRFYEKLGYETVFYHREYTVPAKAGPVKLTMSTPTATAACGKCSSTDRFCPMTHRFCICRRWCPAARDCTAQRRTVWSAAQRCRKREPFFTSRSFCRTARKPRRRWLRRCTVKVLSCGRREAARPSAWQRHLAASACQKRPIWALLSIDSLVFSAIHKIFVENLLNTHYNDILELN